MMVVHVLAGTAEAGPAQGPMYADNEISTNVLSPAKASSVNLDSNPRRLVVSQSKYM